MAVRLRQRDFMRDQLFPYAPTVDVFLLYHVHHARLPDGSPTRHFDEDGELTWDEQEGDDVKLLGVYSTHERAQARIREARALPGFKDEPECFLIVRSEVDKDAWVEGYTTYYYSPTTDRVGE